MREGGSEGGTKGQVVVERFVELPLISTHNYPRAHTKPAKWGDKRENLQQQPSESLYLLATPHAQESYIRVGNKLRQKLCTLHCKAYHNICSFVITCTLHNT